MQSNISCTDITWVSYVILDHVSTFGHFQLNRKLHKFHLFDMNSKLTDNKLHHLLLTVNKIGKKHSLQRDKYFREDNRIHYFSFSVWNLWLCTMNEEILKNVINMLPWFSVLPVNDEPLNMFGTWELLFPISKRNWFLFCSNFQKRLLLTSCHIPKSIILVPFQFPKFIVLISL